MIVEEAVEDGLPSVSLKLVSGTDSLTVVRGVVNRNSGAPAEVTSRYHVASNGKLVVAITVLRLFEQGLLSLDEPVTNWLNTNPYRAVLTDDITVRMLLSHTSGLPDYLQTPGYLEALAQAPDRRWDTDEIVTSWLPASRLSAAGAAFSYSNTNYLLLGALIEEVTSLPLSAALRFWVLDDISAPNTFHPDEVGSAAPLARGYLDQRSRMLFPGGAEIEANPWTEAHWFADAPLQSTPTDWVALVRAALTPDGLLAADTLQKLTTPAIAGSAYGLGIFTAIGASGEIVYFHGGAIWGFRSEFIHVPERDLTIAIFTNGEGEGHNQRYETMFSRILTLLQLNDGR